MCATCSSGTDRPARVAILELLLAGRPVAADVAERAHARTAIELAPELRAWIVDEYLHDFSVDVRSRQALTYAHDTEYKLPVAACEGCVARSTCSGVYREDAKRHGDGAYVTITLPTTPPAAPPAP